MSTPNSTLSQRVFKPTDSDAPLTPKEYVLTLEYGDLHEVIPPLANNGLSLRQIAQKLSNKRLSVSYSFVRRWMQKNGYEQMYIRTDGGES